MKNRARFPVTEIGGTTTPRLILGHLPFMGESYQGPEKNHQYAKRFSNIENIVRILCRAIDGYGIKVVAATPTTEGTSASRFLEAIQESMRRTAVEIALIPCFRIPLTIDGKPIDDYRRWLTYYDIEKQAADETILKRYVEDPILLCREGWGKKFPYALTHLHSYAEEDFKGLEVDYRMMKRAASSLAGSNILFGELGSETDFLVAAERLDLLSELVDWLRDSLGRPVLLGVHHAGSTIPTLERSRIRFEGYVTPVNKLGVMMFPTEEHALKAIWEANKPVIAIKPLAGGRIPPSEAFGYIYKEIGVKVCMIGVGSTEEVDEDFEAALESLSD